jgi:hypothetical protein
MNYKTFPIFGKADKDKNKKCNFFPQSVRVVRGANVIATARGGA